MGGLGVALGVVGLVQGAKAAKENKKQIKKAEREQQAYSQAASVRDGKLSDALLNLNIHNKY